MRAVFADTFYWIALINPNDSRFQQAVQFDDLLSDAIVYTTEEVLGEFLTFFAADPWLRRRAVDTVREIVADPDMRIIRQSHESFLSGFSLYAERPDKAYSLTDCISMQTMRREGLTDVSPTTGISNRKGSRALFRDS